MKAGEELTIEYNAAHRLKATHTRRYLYLRNKEFTCHCSRCDNPADDTRQFSCFNSKCIGRHYACQPINKDPLPRQSHLHYTGVEYVEPHLLSCTVCNRTPPAEYQQRMFALESRLPEVNTHNYLPSSTANPIAARKKWKELNSMYVPPLHARSESMLRDRFRLQVSMADDYQALYDTGVAYVRLFEVMAQFPNREAFAAFRDTAMDGFIPAHKMGAVPGALAAALKYAGKALRMYLLLLGRGKPTTITVTAELKAYYDGMVEALELQGGDCCGSSSSGGNCCLLCGESPDCAAIVLCKCGKCKQAQYCCVGCQRAHWKLHKKQCCV